jgi:hypothetical protein
VSAFVPTIWLSMIVIALATLQPAPQTSDPQLGTWTLNLAKSTFHPGPAPQSMIRRFEKTDDGIKYTSDTVDAAGKSIHVEYIANFDGGDYPLVGSRQAETIALKRVDAYTLEVTQKRNGKVVIIGTRVISKDGRIATVKNKGTDADGQAIDNVLVFEKR